jgi:hypothetical protein
MTNKKYESTCGVEPWELYTDETKFDVNPNDDEAWAWGERFLGTVARVFCYYVTAGVRVTGPFSPSLRIFFRKESTKLRHKNRFRACSISHKKTHKNSLTINNHGKVYPEELQVSLQKERVSMSKMSF